MTAEEIKSSTSMQELMRQYGISIRNSMCKCPFHSDNTASMKVFNDGCHCFTCNESWDIFSFTQKMEHCDFRTAFISLGGTYEHSSGDGQILRKARIDRQRKAREQAEIDKIRHRKEFYKAWTLCQVLIEESMPYSDSWCEAYNFMDLIENHCEDFERGGDIKQNVFNRCVEFNKRYLTIE